jgi:hypothetical protein
LAKVFRFKAFEDCYNQSMSFPQPYGERLMQALMSRPQMMTSQVATLMMQLMAKVGEEGQAQGALQSRDQRKIAETFGLDLEEFQILQSQVQNEFTKMSQENPELANQFETMMEQFGQVPPSQRDN